ncbi:SDR family NAD(P)-dependent oxidoreductase [Catalinimonas niigatensis]|uniref:SDR family NAD(P)-dependent oxidoreductase n=1 Tax=Catalinimonas niigatensis TaxID=1397264 RepID=UPI0026665C31|nr:SDR family oxidoreductase [Catalinimonas niigatensis]WPP48873.1 SDR family oxidoreductase [Catalinimonas niigatensis]
MNNTQKTLAWSIAGIAGIALARLLTHKHRSIEFDHKVTLITGGSRGLGLEMARILVKEGARVAICARDKDELKQAKKDLNELAATYGGNGVYTVVCDVTDPDQVKDMLKQIKKHFGAIEILINNAGVIQIAPAEEMEKKEYEEAMNLHFWAPYHLMEAVLPDMKKKGEGRIVNIASLAGKVVVPHLAPYTASKHALVGLSESLHAEMQKYNIYITTVCPGLMRTGSVRQMIHKGQHRKEHALAEIITSQPLTSMDAKSAAQSIVSACKNGETSLIMPLQAKLITAANGLFPGLVADMMGLVNRLLPGPGGIGKLRAKGYESLSEIVPSLLRNVNIKAAQRNNEYH